MRTDTPSEDFPSPDASRSRRIAAASAVYAAATLLLVIVAVYCILVCLRLFLTSRSQAVAAVVLLMASVPVIVMHIPGLPFALHATNGLGLVIALLAVRQISQIPYLRGWRSTRD